MINQFPKLSKFFRKNSFTQDDIINLLDDLFEKHQEKNIRKTIVSLIELELLKYKIDPSYKPKKLKEKAEVRKSVSKSKPVVASIKKQTVFLEFENKTITEVGKLIKMDPNLIIEQLKQNGRNYLLTDILLVKDQKFLNDHTISLARAYIRRKKDNKKITSQKRIKRTNNNSFPSGVYGSLQLHGPGKIIYIRSK